MSLAISIIPRAWHQASPSHHPGPRPKQTEWWDKYKYDIPVLHVNGAYWTKHRVTAEEVVAAVAEARTGAFAPRGGQPA